MVITSVLWFVIVIPPLVVAATFWPQPTEAQGLNTVQIGAFLLTFPVFALLAPRVSYRWFDAFFLLIPIFSVIWQLIILWRVSLLPLRDWEPRPDEVGRWTLVTDQPRRLYLKRPADQDLDG